MKRLMAMPDTVIAAQAQPNMGNRLGVLAGELIRQAAELTVNGASKHEAVKQAIKSALFGTVAKPEDMKRWLKDLNPIGGWAGKVIGAALNLVPIERVVDAVLDIVVRSVYAGMKRAGVAI